MLPGGGGGKGACGGGGGGPSPTMGMPRSNSGNEARDLTLRAGNPGRLPGRGSMGEAVRSGKGMARSAASPGRKEGGAPTGPPAVATTANGSAVSEGGASLGDAINEMDVDERDGFRLRMGGVKERLPRAGPVGAPGGAPAVGPALEPR